MEKVHTKPKLIILNDDLRDEQDLLNVPSLEKLQKAVGGHIERVPYFRWFEGQPCVAFCNEEGKLKELPVNTEATNVWWEPDNGGFGDYLVGDIAIVVGDPQFLNLL